MRSRQRKWLLTTIVLVVTYSGSFYCWKHLAMARCAEYGMVGYYFLWPPGQNLMTESMLRLFYFPMIILDEKVLGGVGPASPPTERLSQL